MITYQEAAHLVKWPNPDRTKEIHDFVLTAPHRDVQLFLHNITLQVPPPPHFQEWFDMSIATIGIKIAGDQSKASETMEGYTVTLVNLTKTLRNLTWVIVFLTIGLLALTIRLVVHP